jgi:hypothetical protein
VFIDNQITRFQNGINNAPRWTNDIFNSLPTVDDTRMQQFFDDFMDFVPTAWTVTETQAGATQAPAAGAGGLLLLTNSAANNDVNQIQTNAGSFLPVAGKKTFMKCRFQLSDVLLSAFAIGIQTVSADGTVLANALDGIFFLKASAAATIDIYVRQANAGANSVNATVATLVNATDVELGAFYDGVDRVYYSVNGAVLGYVTVSSAILPNAVMAPIISLKNGEAVAKTATVDYLFVAQER